MAWTDFDNFDVLGNSISTLSEIICI